MDVTYAAIPKGHAAQWLYENPVLDAGQPGYESNTGKFKLGDGVSHWLDLPYFSAALISLDAMESTIADGIEAAILLHEEEALAEYDSRYISANDAVGSRLAAAGLATGTSLTAVGAAYVDITGLVIAPVIGTRGVDVEVLLPVCQGSASKTFVVALIDVTAGVQIDQAILITASGGWGNPVNMKCDVAPAAGVRTYKAQVKCIGGAPADIAFYGENTGTRAAILCTQR